MSVEAKMLGEARAGAVSGDGSRASGCHARKIRGVSRGEMALPRWQVVTFEGESNDDRPAEANVPGQVSPISSPRGESALRRWQVVTVEEEESSDDGPAEANVPGKVSPMTSPRTHGACAPAATCEVALPSEDPTPCDEKAVVGLGVVLEHMATLAPSPERMTCFHSVRPAAMGIQGYLTRICRFFDCSLECYVLGLIYIDRVIKRCPHVVFSKLSGHRLLLCSMLLAAKFHDDRFYANTYYAKVGGLRLDELNGLERSMLRMLDHHLLVPLSEFEVYRAVVYKAAASAH